MCGFVCVMRHRETSEAFPMDDLKQRSAIIKHRGPDAKHVYYDEVISIAFTSQPMSFANSRYRVICNGTILNEKNGEKN